MENNILKEYSDKVEKLNLAFKELKQEGLVPITYGEKEYTAESLAEVQTNLEKQEFTISVCGQINAGKSSFLNYLLFNDKIVLPADDTPWTAKLTTVRYGLNDIAKVTYYNKAEWEQLKSQKVVNDAGEETTYYEEFLKSDVNNAVLKGLQIESYIASTNKIEEGVPLDALVNYVTKGGDLTPFVKQVDIKVNNEIAKGVVFVDTPGINDRNELRSKVTEDWIKNSCAVIYLFYAGQALSSADYDFIDQHLSSVPTDKIIFALTKADVSEDYASAKTFVETQLKEDVELKKRSFITKDKSVYPISTLAALLNYKLKNNIELDEDEEFHLDRINDDCQEFINKNGFVDSFVSGLKSHLMTQTGAAIINKTVTFLEDVYKTNVSALTSDINGYKDKLNALELSTSELKSKRNIANSLLDAIEKFKKKFKNNELDDFIYGLKHDLDTNFTKLSIQQRDSLKSELKESSDDSIKSLRNLAVHKAKNHLQEYLQALEYQIKIKTKVKEQIADLLSSFSFKFMEVIGSSDIEIHEGGVYTNTIDSSAILENIHFDSLSVEELKRTCGKNYGQLINKDSVKAQIMSQIEKVFEESANKSASNVLANVENVIEANMNELLNKVNVEIVKIKKNIGDLLSTSTQKSDEREGIRKEIVIATERLEFVNDKFKSFQKWM